MSDTLGKTMGMIEKLTKGQRTQRKIIESTLSLIGQHGFEKTSLQLIANQLGLSQTAILRHFPNRDILFESVRKFVTQSNYEFVDAQINIEDDAYHCLLKYFNGNLQWAHKNREYFQIILLTYYQGSLQGAGAEVVKGVLKKAQERILKYLHAGQREGLFHFNQSIHDKSEVLHSFLLGNVIKSVCSTQNKTAPLRVMESHKNFLHESLGIKNTKLRNK